MAWLRSTPVAEGILAGSPDAEREFVERYLPRLRAFFGARLSRVELREDLTQETLLAALVALRAGKLRDAAALDAYVLGVARNHLAEALRAGARQPTATSHVDTAAPELAPELRLTVQRELQQLPALDQLILWLLLIEGCRPAEVAPRAGLSEEAVRQRKSRLLRRLHEKISGLAVTKPPAAETLSGNGVESS